MCRGVEGAHDFLGNSANTDLICQAKGEPGQAPVPTPTLKTNKQTNMLTNKVKPTILIIQTVVLSLSLITDIRTSGLQK